MKIKRIFVLLFAAITSIDICMAYDHIIFRNGQESDVKLYQINDDKIVFGYIGDNTGFQKEVSSKDVYMVYIEKQGNVYLTTDGKRITGEAKRVDPKKQDAIYLVKGAEIGAENIRITENNIKYSVRTKGQGFSGLISKGNLSESTLEKSEVFMIRYKSGMVDIITPIDVVPEVVVDTTSQKEPEPQFVVVFHEVKRGDTLNKVADNYNVSTEQLREWNDIPSRTKDNSPLATGMQLMIYQPKK